MIKMNYRFFYCFVVMILFGCSPSRNTMIKSGDNFKDIAIYNAILDFSKTSLYRKDSVFSVSVTDSLFTYALGQNDDGHFIGIRDKYFDEIIVVSILGHPDYQFYYSEERKGIPTRFIIKDDKLFYWRDNSKSISDELIAIFWKYNLLQDEYLIPDYSLNHSKKGVDYFFCKNDLTTYIRVISKIPAGYYEPPNLKCF